MIGSIRGRVTHTSEKSVLVEQGGIGFEVNADKATLLGLELDQEVFLFTHTHVREDVIALYGFVDREDLEFFQMLLGISGIGPKGALGIMSVAPTETLKQSIKKGDAVYLTKVGGIGKKTAQKITLELKDKIILDNDSETVINDLEVLEALEALGYTKLDARNVLKDLDASLDTNTKIKEAIKKLGS